MKNSEDLSFTYSPNFVKNLSSLLRCGNSNSLYFITRFATVERGGLLIYNGRLNEKHDFLAVEIVDGQVQLKYSTGGCGR